MALTQRLDLRQSQSLVMTPQLQQAIKLLQLSNMELAAFVETELETNPMLERDEGEADRAGDAPERGADADLPDRPDANSADSLDMLQPSGMTDAADAPLDVDYRDQFEGDIAGPDVAADRAPDLAPGGDGAYWEGARNTRGFDDEGGGVEATLAQAISLRDHLLEQVQMDLTEVADRLIGAYLVDSLDESGWLATPSDSVADALGCSVADVERVLNVLQQFDPPGVFARSLGECLALQLRDRNRLDPAMQAMLDNLELLAARDFRRLMKLCGVDREDLAEMIDEIRSLDPRPALAFADEVVQPVVPDVLMRRAQDGGWLIELNAEMLPRVLVNESYFATVSSATRDRKALDYVQERFQTANWLVKSLHQRATTIVKVASEIVRQQNGFFEHGVSHLRPLVLRDIAEAISMHESTVSRVTSNKYIATPRGLFELKYFFTAAIQSTGDGDALSAETVRHRIRALIDAESADAVLSDDKIVEILRGEGVDIARRTVAKYREAMRIASSVQRRRMKKQAI